MKDRLAEFIQANREAFDDKEPDKNGWNVIASTLPASGKLKFWNSVAVWRAAAMLFMALSVYLLVPKDTVNKNDSATMAMKEFNDVDAYYNQEIYQKVKLIEEISTIESTNTFTQDFKQLESMYYVLKEEMKTSPSEKVKDALVLNFLVRINLLNQQL